MSVVESSASRTGGEAVRRVNLSPSFVALNLQRDPIDLVGGRIGPNTSPSTAAGARLMAQEFTGPASSDVPSHVRFDELPPETPGRVEPRQPLPRSGGPSLSLAIPTEWQPTTVIVSGPQHREALELASAR